MKVEGGRGGGCEVLMHGICWLIFVRLLFLIPEWVVIRTTFSSRFFGGPGIVEVSPGIGVSFLSAWSSGLHIFTFFARFTPLLTRHHTVPSCPTQIMPS